MCIRDRFTRILFRVITLFKKCTVAGGRATKGAEADRLRPDNYIQRFDSAL